MTIKNRPSYKLRSAPERHEAIAKLADLRGFKSVSEYVHSLIDKDAEVADFKLPDKELSWGGNRK